MLTPSLTTTKCRELFQVERAPRRQESQVRHCEVKRCGIGTVEETPSKQDEEGKGKDLNMGEKERDYEI